MQITDIIFTILNKCEYKWSLFQARIAADEGAIGLILYTDPVDYSPEGVDFTYPKSWWLPPSGVQRGTLLNFEQGDPLTPGYPARGKECSFTVN